MRVTAIVAGAALVLAACGGGNKNAATNPDSTGGGNMAQATPPAAAAGTGTTHVIEMVQEGTNSYKFVPADITIKQGDAIEFKGVSGLQHDVAFYADSIPPGAAAVLNAAITDEPQNLATPMISDGQSVTISFANAPTGTYKFYCIPHEPMGMKGTITVQ